MATLAPTLSTTHRVRDYAGPWRDLPIRA